MISFTWYDQKEPERANGNVSVSPDPPSLAIRMILRLMLPGGWGRGVTSPLFFPYSDGSSAFVCEKTLPYMSTCSLLGKMRNFNPHPPEKLSWVCDF